jgi:hypothetical protein
MESRYKSKNLERRKETGDWIDHPIPKECNVIYSAELERAVVS